MIKESEQLFYKENVYVFQASLLKIMHFLEGKMCIFPH